MLDPQISVTMDPVTGLYKARVLHLPSIENCYFMSSRENDAVEEARQAAKVAIRARDYSTKFVSV